jgi:hypothetical protein
METEDRIVNTDLVVNVGRERFGLDIIRLEGKEEMARDCLAKDCVYDSTWKRGRGPRE